MEKETRGRPKKYKTKKQREAAFNKQNNEWKKNNTRCINVRFNLINDKDILEKLDSVPNKGDYIRQLILADLDEKKQ